MGGIGGGYVSLCEPPRFHLALDVGVVRHTVACVGSPENFDFAKGTYLTFIFYLTMIFIVKHDTMNKRVYRELDDETKRKISQAMKGRHKNYAHRQKIKNYAHRQKISRSMRDYWRGVPSRNNQDNDGGVGNVSEN